MPFAKPENVYVPFAATVVVADEAPDSVTVAAEPLTVPEMLYLMGVPVKLTPVKLDQLTVSCVLGGVKV